MLRVDYLNLPPLKLVLASLDSTLTRIDARRQLVPKILLFLAEALPTRTRLASAL